MSYLKQEICLCFSWLYPQNLQLNFNFSFPLCEVLFIWQPFLPPVVLVSEFWVILLTLVQELGWVALSLNSLTCLFDRSKALHIFTALSSVKLSSLRSNSWSFPVTVKTILSLNIRSFSRKLHAAALVFSSVRNLSNGSWYECSRIDEIRWLHCHAGCSIFPMLLKLYQVYLYRHHLSK